jgi:hypothetical protein
MRVLLNGCELPDRDGGLDGGLERRLAGGVRSGPLDSVALSPAGSVAARARQLRLLLGGVGALVVVLLAVNLAVVGARVPQVMGYAAMAGVAGVLFTGALVWLIYTLMLLAHRRRVEARPATGMVEGEHVRVAADGLAAGDRLSAWPGLRIDELWVRERLANERRVTYPERLALSDGHRTIVLDALLQTGGQPLLEQAWRRLKLAEAGR